MSCKLVGCPRSVSATTMVSPQVNSMQLLGDTPFLRGSSHMSVHGAFDTLSAVGFEISGRNLY